MSAQMDSAAFAAVVQQVRDRFPVSGVASKAAVKLQRAGNEWKGCCPFHPDRTPIFAHPAPDTAALLFKLDLAEREYSGFDLDETVTKHVLNDVRRFLRVGA